MKPMTMSGHEVEFHNITAGGTYTVEPGYNDIGLSDTSYITP
jgi:hypothetical protein